MSPPPYDPQKAKQLLAETGYPNGIDAGDFVPNPPFVTAAEVAVNFLNAVGIRVKIRTMERAAFLAAWRDKKLRGLFLATVGNSGNAASRIEAFIYSKGSYAYGGYPDMTTCSSSRRGNGIAGGAKHCSTASNSSRSTG